MIAERARRASSHSESLDDVKKELTHLPAPWIVLDSEENSPAVGVLKNFMVTLHVIVGSDLMANVTVLDTPAPHLNNNIESVHLGSFLKCISDMHP